MINLGNRIISRDSRDFYIIAEIGVNHEGNIELAKKLIELAKEGGAHAAKFQAYKAETLASKHSPAYWDTRKETTQSQYELFKKYDSFGDFEYQELARHCEKVGISFMCTAFDTRFVDVIDPLVSAHKIASADLTNTPLLRKIAQSKKPIILSTGASHLGEIYQSIEALKNANAQEIALLHCVLNYPTPDEQAFLGRLKILSNSFPQYCIGYSDHTLPHDTCFPVVLAYALGARIIEKHFTHDKSLPGNDHYHAMDVKDLRGLVSNLERASKLFGNDSEKEFLSSQSRAICHARRSIVVNGKISAGERLSPDKLTVKRPGSGISPIHWDEVIGKRISKDLNDDHILKWADLES